MMPDPQQIRPCVFDWKKYRDISHSEEVRILSELALSQWHDGNDLIEEMETQEVLRFAEGFSAGFLAGRIVGEIPDGQE